MKIRRRVILRGIGGATLGLPLLESFGPVAKAQGSTNAFAIFLRQANGVAQADNGEPERFWPTAQGALTDGTLSGRALDELSNYKSRLLVLRGVDMQDYDYGDGHARGAMQGLTASPANVPGQGGNSEAGGMSVDHLIGEKLNPQGRESLYLYAGANNGWLGGPCISYRGPGQRRSADRNPWTAYLNISGGQSGGMSDEAITLLTERRKSVNDLVRDQLSTLMKHPKLGSADKMRLELHSQSVRDLEVALGCNLSEGKQMELDTGSNNYEEGVDGGVILQTARLHAQVAALAVSCGFTKSVAIQIGNGNDGSTRYPDPDTGSLMSANYHYISHRRLSHDSSGTPIPGSDLLHHKIDRAFAKTFNRLLELLAAYPGISGGSLLDEGVAVWYND
ncbi:MAG: DUF1552 domain-containing protein, partial [Myxococcales bacterium]|nr:DUF1552 domain-containing protein [Myxococcales bacterium]